MCIYLRGLHDLYDTAKERDGRTFPVNGRIALISPNI